MEGFAAFRDRTEVDFTGFDLVALVGPTGSGKSTVIDAVTFALYGSVARYGNTSLVAPVIHQLSTEAKVRFDFELAGATYVAVRIVRRAKSKPGGPLRATTKEARLERVDPDGTSTVIAGNVKELDWEIETLLGLGEVQLDAQIEEATLESEDAGIVEASLAPRSAAAGRTLAQLHFRDRYGLQVLAVWREGNPIHAGLANLPLHIGDALLIQGTWEKIRQLAEESDFVVLTRLAQAPRRTEKAFFALAGLLGLIGVARRNN